MDIWVKQISNIARSCLGLFKILLVYSTSFLLILACCCLVWVIAHFVKKVEAHKALRKLETLKKVKARKVRKKSEST